MVTGDEYGDTSRVQSRLRDFVGKSVESKCIHHLLTDFSLLCPQPFFTPRPRQRQTKTLKQSPDISKTKTKQNCALYIMLFRDSCQAGTQQLPTAAAEDVQLDSIQAGGQQTTLSLVGVGVFSFLGVQ